MFIRPSRRIVDISKGSDMLVGVVITSDRELDIVDSLREVARHYNDTHTSVLQQKTTSVSNRSGLAIFSNFGL